MATFALDHPDVRSNVDLLSAWIEGQLAYRGWPGLSIAVVHERDVVWSRGFGWADVAGKVEATAEKLYRVASITKTSTATAILQLRDAGKLRLDDEVRHHLPWFTPPTSYTDAPPITLRHILTHTTGLAREAPFPYWTDLDFPAIDAIRAAVPAQASVLATEDRWKYSNLAFVVAGEVVSAVSGMPWTAYVRSHILDPLGMRTSLVEHLALSHPGLARGYTRRLPSGERSPVGAYDLRGVSAAAALTTSVPSRALRDAAVPPGPCGRRWDPPRQHAEGDAACAVARAGMAGRLGLGFHMYRMGQRTLVGHGGSLRGYRSEIRSVLAERVAVIVLINADDGEPQLVVNKTFEWVGSAITRATMPPPPTADPAWQRYVGRYRNAWGDLQVLVVGGASQ